MMLIYKSNLLLNYSFFLILSKNKNIYKFYSTYEIREIEGKIFV